MKKIINMIITFFLVCVLVLTGNNTIKTRQEKIYVNEGNYERIRKRKDISETEEATISKNKVDVVSTPKLSNIEKAKVLKQKQEQELKETKKEEYQEKLVKLNNQNISKQEWFIKYKKLQKKYSKWIKVDTTIYDDFSDYEILYIEKCVETEVYQGDFNSKVNVASVIFNRLKDDRFGNDLISVVTGKNQFAYGRNNITSSTRLAVEYAYQMKDTTNGSIGFNSFQSFSYNWNGWEYQFTDNVGHHFYK